MSVRDLLEYANIVQLIMCLAVLATMVLRRVARIYPALVGFVGLTALTQIITVPLLFFRRYTHVSIDTAYSVYFYSMWVSEILSLALLVMIIYGLFTEAMRPFPGLHRIGKLIFRWVGVVSFAVATALVMGPQLFAKGMSTTAAIAQVASRFQQGVSVLILCLLIFVTFAIRPLGLTFRSHIFGVVLGLAMTSTVYLVEAAWYATKGALSLYSPIYLLSSIGFCVSLAIWGAYFGLPEPERRMILLPTTSPFFLWNRISEILGDEPGKVAVAGFKPEMLAPAELEMLTAATSREAAAERARDLEWIEPPSPISTRPELPVAARHSLALSR